MGVDREELSDKIVSTLDFDKNGQRIFDYGTRKFIVNLTPSLEIEVFDENNKQASNFFTYEAITNMISEMIEVADLLEQDYENQSLRSIIEKYDVHYLHDSDDEAWSTGEFGELKDHIYIVSDFYRRLSNKLSQMMAMNPNAFLINFEYGY